MCAVQKIVVLVLLALCFGTAAICQRHLTAMKDQRWSAPTLSYLSQGEKIKPYLLGFHTAYASYLWIRTTLYFGSHITSDNQFPWLYRMLDMVTQLNPRFFPAYEFAGLVLPDLTGEVDVARILLERGIFYLGDNNWKVWFYCGMLYYRYYNDSQRAAEFLAHAARVPGKHAEKLAGYAATLYQKAGTGQQAVAFLDMMYETSENPAVRRYLKQRLQKALLESDTTHSSNSEVDL
jgi:hypothetical protein